MRSLFKVIYIAITGICFSTCGSSQKFVLTQQPPFKLGEVLCEHWSAGDGSKGFNLYLPVHEGKTTELDSVYFRGQTAKLEKIRKGTYLVFIGRFMEPQKKDLIMHADPKKEFGNQGPVLMKKLPFDLGEDEAVVSYHENDKIKYFLIKPVNTTTPIHYPEASPLKKQD